MGKITAKGKYRAMDLKVVCEMKDLKIVTNLDGTPAGDDFHELLKHRFPMGGTYYPEEQSLLNAVNVLECHFFDGVPEIIVDGDIGEIPFEEGVIY